MKKKDILGLKYYISFVVVVLLIYVYSMVTGWRYLSFGEASHNNNKNSRTYYRSFNHK